MGFIKDLLFSPFKFPKIKFYLGKVKIGVPYFLPRRSRKMTWNEALEKAIETTSNPNHYRYKERLSSLTKDYRKSRLKFVPKKMGWDFVRLGYKYKFGQIRFEWNPMFSFVFFGLQFCIFILPEHDHQYWESWLYYHKETDKTKSVKERVEQCRKEAPQRWTCNGVTTDYYELILKNKWL